MKKVLMNNDIVEMLIKNNKFNYCLDLLFILICLYFSLKEDLVKKNC